MLQFGLDAELRVFLERVLADDALAARRGLFSPSSCGFSLAGRASTARRAVRRPRNGSFVAPKAWIHDQCAAAA
jgi:hypothetical protein